MTHNNQPSSFFNNPESDDDAETNIDMPYGTPSPQGPYNPYISNPNAPYNQPPNYGQSGPMQGSYPPKNPQGYPAPNEYPNRPTMAHRIPMWDMGRIIRSR
jgi:hypothetical protein